MVSLCLWSFVSCFFVLLLLLFSGWRKKSGTIYLENIFHSITLAISTWLLFIHLSHFTWDSLLKKCHSASSRASVMEGWSKIENWMHTRSICHPSFTVWFNWIKFTRYIYSKSGHTINKWNPSTKISSISCRWNNERAMKMWLTFLYRSPCVCRLFICKKSNLIKFQLKNVLEWWSTSGWLGTDYKFWLSVTQHTCTTSHKSCKRFGLCMFWFGFTWQLSASTKSLSLANSTTSHSE